MDFNGDYLIVSSTKTNSNARNILHYQLKNVHKYISTRVRTIVVRVVPTSLSRTVYVDDDQKFSTGILELKGWEISLTLTCSPRRNILKYFNALNYSLLLHAVGCKSVLKGGLSLSVFCLASSNILNTVSSVKKQFEIREIQPWKNFPGPRLEP